jgi:anti-anti-sigma factor
LPGWRRPAGWPLVLDLDLVTFIEAAGLNVLAGAGRRAAARRSSLHVVSSWEQLWRLTRITGLDDQVLLARTLG